VNAAEIKKKIDSFPRWHYQFDLKGQLTPIFDKEIIRRHVQRKKYFFDPLVQFFGGSLKGKRVLDLGCNAGYWALHAAQSGCDFVLGVDGRSMHVDQANFVFEVNEIEKSRYQFIQKDIFDLDPATLGQFDIVFCLGIMYHISKPMSLMESMSRMSNDILLIDTTLSQATDSSFLVAHESLDEPRNAIDYELVLIPTKLAVVEMAQQFGYKTLVLKPTHLEDADAEGRSNFKAGARRAFVSAKKSDLSHFPAQAEPVTQAGSNGVLRRAKRWIKAAAAR
jgi:2-polyprenyl-3-methyl-5-hydroxy-6-metoxy-1,4-benzoquinol methylase